MPKHRPIAIALVPGQDRSDLPLSAGSIVGLWFLLSVAIWIVIGLAVAAIFDIR